MLTTRRVLYSSLVIILALGTIGALARSAMATNVVPETIVGNPSCTDLGYAYGAKWDYPEQSSGGTYPLGTGTVTWSTDGTYVDWGSTFGVDAVIVKGGNAANVYYYSPEASGDTGLVSPNNSSGGPAGLSHVDFCYDYEVQVSKTASTSYTRTYTWDIDKSVSPGALDLLAGEEPGQVVWDVTVTRIETDSDFKVSGTITIVNPDPNNTATIESVSDSLGGAPDCSVTLPYGLGPGLSLTCSYTVSVPDKTGGINTATVTTSGLVGGGSASADYSFGDPTDYVGFATVDVGDDLQGGLGQAGAGVTPFSYPTWYDCSQAVYEAGKYSYSVENTATIEQTGQADDAEVAVNCYAPVVTKDAHPTYTRTWNWTISKSVEPVELDMFRGDSGTVEWTVSWDKTGFTDSAFAVNGSIWIHNPAPKDMALGGVADVVMQGGEEFEAAVTCPDPLVVPAGGDVECTYSTGLRDARDGQNTATATLNDLPFSGSADVNFGGPTTVVDAEVNIGDTNGYGWGPVSDDGSESYSQTFTCDQDGGEHENIASIAETGAKASATATVNCYALEVTKDAETSLTRTWAWTIDKSGSQTALTLSPGQQFLVNYAVTVDATSQDSDWAVAGTIYIHNPAPIAATLTGVYDELAVDEDHVYNVAVDCPGLTVAAGGTLECAYTKSLGGAWDGLNTATARLQNSPSGTTDFSGAAGVSFAGAKTDKVDECIDVTDDKYGSLGTVCADDAPKTFTYSLWVGPYSSCGKYSFVNTASFITVDTQITGSDSWTVAVDVPCGGCTLTPGYWKTHSRYGPAPYDDTWALKGEDTLFYMSGVSWYTALWTNPQGNAYWILAHAYIAASMNGLNGADTSAVSGQMTSAQSLFNSYTPADVASMKGNKGNTLRAQFILLASVLDQYNNGLTGPGHCSE